MLTLTSLLDDALAVINAKSACAPAVNYVTSIKTAATAGKDTIEEFCKLYLADETKLDDIAFWGIMEIGNQLDREVRLKFIEKIKEPMTVFQLYLQCADLTDDEDKVLELKFKGLLPNAERELEKGIVRRVKTVKMEPIK